MEGRYLACDSRFVSLVTLVLSRLCLQFWWCVTCLMIIVTRLLLPNSLQKAFLWGVIFSYWSVSVFVFLRVCCSLCLVIVAGIVWGLVCPHICCAWIGWDWGRCCFGVCVLCVGCLSQVIFCIFVYLWSLWYLPESLCWVQWTWCHGRVPLYCDMVGGWRSIDNKGWGEAPPPLFFFCLVMRAIVRERLRNSTPYVSQSQIWKVNFWKVCDLICKVCTEAV